MVKVHYGAFFLCGAKAQIGSRPPLFMRFLDDTQVDTRPIGLLWKGNQPVTEAATYTTHNKHKIRTSMPSEGFEP